MTDWSVYLLRCSDGSLYTGIATDVARRIREHESGTRGAKYLRGRGPFELVVQIPVVDREQALRLEHRIKRLSRTGKQAMVDDPRRVQALLQQTAAPP